MFKIERPATAIQTNLGAIFISMELSRSTWLITALLPGSSGKMSKHNVKASDLVALFDLFSKLRERCRSRTGYDYPIISIQEAGLDGFWIHRLLQGNGIDSHVVDAASIAAPRRSRRAKTDRIDGEALIRVLMAYKRDEPRVCSIVRAPSPEEEDRRRIGRERRQLTTERVSHSNRIRGLLFSQGVTDYNPVLKDRRSRLEELRTGDGRALPAHLKAQICRELDRLELVLEQLKMVEHERDALIAAQAAEAQPSPVAMLLGVRGIGAEFANALWSECLFRDFSNRRQIAAYAGLAPTPWKSGSIDREQGVAKAGNPRLRTMLIQMAWLWLHNQPDSVLSQWFKARVDRDKGRRKTSAIVALARKLLVALWKYVTSGVVIEGAAMKRA
jgi:transposase